MSGSSFAYSQTTFSSRNSLTSCSVPCCYDCWENPGLQDAWSRGTTSDSRAAPLFLLTCCCCCCSCSVCCSLNSWFNLMTSRRSWSSNCGLETSDANTGVVNVKVCKGAWSWPLWDSVTKIRCVLFLLLKLTWWRQMSLTCLGSSMIWMYGPWAETHTCWSS